MKLFDALKLMFTNKPEVEKVRKPNITFSTFIHSNYRMLAKDGNGSFIWMVIFNPTMYMEFVQIAEVIPFNFKTYPFEKEIIVLIPLTVKSMEHILMNMRFINNPFFMELCKEIGYSVPYKVFSEKVLVKSPLKFFKLTDRIIEDYKETNDDFVEPDLSDLPETERFQDGLFAEKFGIVACDYVPKIKEKIISTIPKLALYMTNYDVNSLCRIDFQYKDDDSTVVYSMDYLEFLNDYINADSTTAYGRALEDFKIMANMDEYKSNFDLNAEDLVPVLFELSIDNEVDEIILNDMESHNIPDTSKVDKSKIIK